MNDSDAESGESENDLFARREVSLAEAQLGNHCLLGRADLALPDHITLHWGQDLTKTIGLESRPDGGSECGEVGVAPAGACLRPVLLHHLALIHHTLERLHRAHASRHLTECFITDC